MPFDATFTFTARRRSETSDSPASYGCVRMRSRDVIQLYDTVGLGAEVTIVNTDLHSIDPEILPPGGRRGNR